MERTDAAVLTAIVGQVLRPVVVDAIVKGVLEALRRRQPTAARLERKIRAKLAEWQGLLTGDIASARQFMREALTGPLAFEPDGKQYKFSG